MAFTNYTIVPEDGVVVIDGQAAQNVSMAGIPPNVHAIQWYGLRGVGDIQYKVDPLTGILPAPGSFSNPNQYITQTSSAEAIIYAFNNPVTYYSTVNGNVVQGETYSLGSPIIVDTPNTPQPNDTTTLVPGTPEAFQSLYWYNDVWVLSSFDPNLSLPEAQNVLTVAVKSSAGSLGDEQARIYTPVQLFAAADVSLLPTADYAGMDLSEYQTYLDNQVNFKLAVINAATNTGQLYGFDPNIDGNPNP